MGVGDNFVGICFTTFGLDVIVGVCVGDSVGSTEDASEEEIIGVGDGDNDLPLFDSVGLKVAVANATDKLKSLADEVVAEADKDGLADVIQKHIL